jgi:RNA-directed DNA polymerase
MVKAVQAGRHNRVKALQWLLTHSFSGRALAVKRVTENKGRNTPGVDKVTWKTPAAKTNAIASLKRRGYSPLPLRRVFILKKNGRTRPLGIPAMKCRAMQALHLLALGPLRKPPSELLRVQAERSCCAEQCFISWRASARNGWEADIQAVSTKVRLDARQNPHGQGDLKWLKAGYVCLKVNSYTVAGTPEGSSHRWQNA